MMSVLTIPLMNPAIGKSATMPAATVCGSRRRANTSPAASHVNATIASSISPLSRRSTKSLPKKPAPNASFQPMAS